MRKFYNIIAVVAIILLGVKVMSLEDLLTKLARQQALSELEISSLQDEARALDEVRELTKSWVVPGTSQPVFLSPMEIIYSKVLEEDTASIVIGIPQEYTHLLFLGVGQASTGGAVMLNFNDDDGSGNTYRFTNVEADGVNVYSFGDATYQFCPIGNFPASGSGFIYGWVPHYKSDFYKICIGFGTNFTLGTGGRSYSNFSRWEDASTIQKITIAIFGGYDIKAGSVISVYGLK